MNIKYSNVRRLALGCVVLMSPVAMHAQRVSVTHTMPFLKETVDARSAGLGGATMTLANDPNSIYSNPAAAALSAKKVAAAYSFNHTKNEIITGKYQNALGAFAKVNAHSAVLVGARYYVMLTPATGMVGETRHKPSDFSFDLGYSYSPVKHLAVAATVSYVQTTPAPEDKTRGMIFSVAGLYERPFQCLQLPAVWRVGAKVSHMGILFDHKDDHLPVAARLGTSLSATIAAHHTLTAMADGICYVNPLRHPVKEAAFGLEYTAYKTVALRGGYHLADEKNGGYSYATCGLGLAYKNVGTGFSYRFAAANTPIEKSWWWSARVTF